MAISLEKRTGAAQSSLISLLKKNADQGHDLGELVAQVQIVLDLSYSMYDRYQNHEVQGLVERALALSLSGLDDDGNVPVFFFHDRLIGPDVVDKQSYRGYVDSFCRRHSFGGTRYARAIEGVVAYNERNGLLRPGQPPVFVIFVSDGDTPDEHKTKKLLKDSASRPIFWQFIGLGYTPEFLRELDEMDGRLVDNVGLVTMQDTLTMDDGTFFDQVIREFFNTWLPAARAAGITTK